VFYGECEGALGQGMVLLGDELRGVVARVLVAGVVG
jgi:hypothetical protein